MPLRDPRPTGKMSLEAAQTLAIDALGYLSNTPDLMQRFLALTGIDAAQIREAASGTALFRGCSQVFHRA